MSTSWAQDDRGNRGPEVAPSERTPSKAISRMVVGPADDRYERDADAIAASVIAGLRSDGGRGVLAAGPSWSGDAVDGSVEPTVSRRPTRIQRRVDVTSERSDAPIASPGRSRIRRAPTVPVRRAAAMTSGAGAGRIQRSPASIGAAGGDLDHGTGSAIERARASGGPLDRDLRRSMERGFGADFSAVRVHHDAGADSLSRSLQATAFTTGRDIFFRDGAYQPSSAAGAELVAHELAHVVQQGVAGTVGGSPVAAGPDDVRRRFTGNLTHVSPEAAAFTLESELYYPRTADVSPEDIRPLHDDEEVAYSSYAELAAGVGLPPFDPELLSEHKAQTWTLKADAGRTSTEGTYTSTTELVVKGTPAPHAAIRMIVVPPLTPVFEDSNDWTPAGRVPADAEWVQLIVSERNDGYRFRNGDVVERVKKGPIPFEVRTTPRSRVTINDKSWVVDTSQLNTPKGGTFEPVAGPLFPPGGPKPEHVKQTNLGDCYFQAAAASVAHTRPGAIEKIMRDMDNGLVLVYLYKVDETGDQPTFEKLSVVVEKSVPKSATGEDLYNKGELWVRLLEKAYARTGYSVAGANRPFRYEDIASGQGTFALRVLLGEAALHHTVASGPTMEDGKYFGLPVTTAVKAGSVTATPTPLPVPWDTASFAAFQTDPNVYDHDTFMQVERDTGPVYVQQLRRGVQRQPGCHAAASTVLYTGAGGPYVPLPDARTYEFIREGVALPGHPGERFLQLRYGDAVQYAKPAEVTRIECATLPDGTPLFPTLQPHSTTTTSGVSTEKRVLSKDHQVPTFGLFPAGGMATAWWTFVQTGQIQALFRTVAGSGPSDVTIDDVRACFATHRLNQAVADRVLQWIMQTKLLPGELGSNVYSAMQLQIHDSIAAALRNKKPVTAGTKTQLAAPSQVQASEGHAGESKYKGLVSQHAYSVLAAPPAGHGGRRTLTVRNPWGEYGRTYDWSKAPAEMAKAIVGGTGTFDIELSDFTKYFDSYAT